jgi:hypothetical protein
MRLAMQERSDVANEVTYLKRELVGIESGLALWLQQLRNVRRDPPRLLPAALLL